MAEAWLEELTCSRIERLSGCLQRLMHCIGCSSRRAGRLRGTAPHLGIRYAVYRIGLRRPHHCIGYPIRLALRCLAGLAYRQRAFLLTARTAAAAGTPARCRDAFGSERLGVPRAPAARRSRARGAREGRGSIGQKVHQRRGVGRRTSICTRRFKARPRAVRLPVYGRLCANVTTTTSTGAVMRQFRSSCSR